MALSRCTEVLSGAVSGYPAQKQGRVRRIWLFTARNPGTLNFWEAFPFALRYFRISLICCLSSRCAAICLAGRFACPGYFLVLMLGEAWLGPSMTLLQQAVRRSVRGALPTGSLWHASKASSLTCDRWTCSGQATSMLLVISALAGNLGPALVGILDPGAQIFSAFSLAVV